MNHAHFIVAITACVIAAGAPGAARGHGEVHKHDAAAAAAPSAAKVVLRGDPLLDQTGKRVRLADDVIADRIAIVNFIYTTCTTVCPVASATFQQLQGKLGTALGKEVVLVSISVDPLRDTPERMHEYAARYQARAGWTWLTGAKPDVDAVLRGFGAYTPNYEDHPAMVLVGDAGGWTRFLGFPSVDQLLGRVQALRVARENKGKVAQHGY